MIIEDGHIINYKTDRMPIATLGPRSILPAPNPSTNETYVIPIRGEVKNHNFFHQLRSWNRQTMDAEKFSVLYVVNNAATDAKTNTESFQENQSLLSIIHYINGKEPHLPGSLSEWEKTTVETARKKGLQIGALDLSTVGFTYGGDVIEQARSIGMMVAKSRIPPPQQDNHYIVSIDADMRLGADVSVELARRFSGQDIGMVRLDYDRYAGEGGKALFQHEGYSRFEGMQGLVESLFFVPQNGFYAIRSSALNEGDLGATPGARDLLKPTQGIVLPAALDIHVEDRARRGFGKFGESTYNELHESHSFDNAFTPLWPNIIATYLGNVALHIDGTKYALQNPSEKSATAQTRALSLLRKWYPAADLSKITKRMEELAASDNQGLGRAYYNLSLAIHDLTNGGDTVFASEYTQKAIGGFADLLGGPESKETQAMLSLVREEARKGSLRHEMQRGFITHAVAELYSLYGKNVTQEDIQQHLLGKKESIRTSFFADNPWIAEEIAIAMRQADSSISAIDELTEKFPEYLRPYIDTEYAQYTAQLRGLTRFIKDALSDPNQFPEVNAFFGYWKPENGTTRRPSI